MAVVDDKLSTDEAVDIVDDEIAGATRSSGMYLWCCCRRVVVIGWCSSIVATKADDEELMILVVVLLLLLLLIVLLLLLLLVFLLLVMEGSKLRATSNEGPIRVVAGGERSCAIRKRERER